jgi:hypothetical protein
MSTNDEQNERVVLRETVSSKNKHIQKVRKDSIRKKERIKKKSL